MTTVENFLLSSFYETIIENAESNILILDKEFTIVSLNPGFYWAFLEAYDIHLRKGDKLFDAMQAVAPRVADRWRIRCQAALKGLSVSDEEQLESNDQTFAWKIYYKAVRLGNDQFVSIFSRNISAAKVHQSKILQQEATLRTILNSLDPSIWLVNDRMELVDFNDNAVSHFFNGYNVTLRPGKNFIELLPEGMYGLRQEWHDRLTNAFQNKVKTSHVDRMNMNGEEKINETTINPAIVDQRIVGLTISITDITRKEIEGKRQRNELREMQKLGSEIDNFLYGVSHDLRAPLLSIISVIKIMNRDYVKDMSLLDTIETTVKRLDNFVTNVITYSREHQVGISADEIDFEKTISSVIDSLTYLENSKFVRYSCVINQEVPFLSDRNRLSSILRNTFASVFQHLDFSENPKVKITIEVEPSAATIQLEESRENTSLQVRQDVFESFFGGADNTTGSGLAFYLVKNMIEKLGGRILLKSSHGIGSGVILKLPNLRSTNY